LGSLYLLSSLSSCNSGGDNINDEQSAGDILANNLDTSINPADDFFDYANGGWIKRNPIPDEERSWGIANLVQEDLYKRLLQINEDAVKNPESAVGKQIAAFWKSGMDTVAINKAGLTPIKPELDLIDKIASTTDLLKVVATFSKRGMAPMFSTYVGQDDMNSEKVSFVLYQGGLGLPSRDYYFNTDDATKKIREAYPKHIERMFNLSGLIPLAVSKARSEAVFQLETKLAKASRKLEDLRDPYKNYNKYSVSDFTRFTTSIDWKVLLADMDINSLDSVIVGQPEFFAALNTELTATSLDVWKDYLKWQVLNNFSGYLHNELEAANFSFYGEKLNGVKKQKPRWKRVLQDEEEAIGEALGQLFVKEYFSETTKKRYDDMVEDIRSALKERIQKLDWMSEPTKVKALEKLAKMRKKVGYPDKWKDFSAMEIKDQAYVRNVIAAKEWWHKYEVNKIGKPVNRDEWSMTPQTYNAYYNPSNNEIVLPAGIFTVAGRRDEQLDDALVYGYAAASTIGHEITHGFDDQGRQYDAEGNLKSWWTKEDEQKFNERAAVMVKQFNGYSPLDKLFINGSATLGENIADLGGVLLGWDAFIKTDQYKSDKKIAGLSPSQRFFLGYSLGWLYHARKEATAQRLLTDVHSPAKFRVNGPFSDVDAFYKTFNVKPGDGMYIPDSLRVKIW